MSDLSASNTQSPEFTKDEPPAGSLWLAIKKIATRLSDWFVIQTTAVKVLVIALALMIPATAIYSAVLLQKQATLAEQVRLMPGGGAGHSINANLPLALAVRPVAQAALPVLSRARHTGAEVLFGWAFGRSLGMALVLAPPLGDAKTLTKELGGQLLADRRVPPMLAL